MSVDLIFELTDAFNILNGLGLTCYC